MSFAVDVNVNKTFKVKAAFNDVFKLLADVPKSVAHFPKVDRLVDAGGNSYRWEMEKIGLDRYFIQTVYTCRYTSNKRDGEVAWEPFDDDDGTAEVSGRWAIKRLGDDTVQVRLITAARISVPLPSLLRILLAGLIENEFKTLIDTYIANLRETLEKAPAKPGRAAISSAG